MQIDHSLTVGAPVERVWTLLRRPESVVGSLPGVRLTALEGEEFSGEMSVGLGPMRLRYAGSGTLRYGESQRTIHIEARGNEARGAGSAAAVVDVTVDEGADESTRLDVSIDLDLQGKPAQFGRGILAEVVTRLATQFGKNLEQQIMHTEEAPTTLEAPTTEAAEPSRAVDRVPAAPAVATWLPRAAVAAAGAVAGAAAVALIGRRRPSVSVVIVGGDDPAWLALARELAAGRRG